jgi:hypothetical protein
MPGSSRPSMCASASKFLLPSGHEGKHCFPRTLPPAVAMSDTSLRRRGVDGRDKFGHDERSRDDAPRVTDPILLPNAQPGKDLAENVLDANAPDNPIHRGCSATKVLGDQFRLRRLGFDREG